MIALIVASIAFAALVTHLFREGELSKLSAAMIPVCIVLGLLVADSFGGLAGLVVGSVVWFFITTPPSSEDRSLVEEVPTNWER